MKKNKKAKEFLDQLRKIPIVQVACEKTGLSRNSIYRWKNEDKEFEKNMEEALAEGEMLVNDMSESQLLTMIKEKEWSAISFWLRHRNPKFKEKIEITTKVDTEKLSPEQEALVRKALSLATHASKPVLNNQNLNHEPAQINTTRVSGNNGQRQESKNSDN